MTPPLTMAQNHATNGEDALARAAALFVAERFPQNREAHEMVTTLFGRPADGFIRLWAWRRVAALAPLLIPERR